MKIKAYTTPKYRVKIGYKDQVYCSRIEYSAYKNDIRLIGKLAIAQGYTSVHYQILQANGVDYDTYDIDANN